MYDRLKNQYIFKLSNGRTTNFFYKENTGLCASMLNKRNMWTESIQIVKDCERVFSADIDKNDNIYILIQDIKGNLSVVQYLDSEHSIRPLLASKNNTAYNKYLSIICSDNGVFFFYVIDHNGQKLLSYQTMNKDSSLTQPRVIDYCLDTKSPYSVFTDNTGTIIIFYYSADSTNNRIGYKVLSPESNSFGDFNPISDTLEYASILGGTCDSTGIYHFLWDKKRDGRYEMCYANKPLGSKNLLSEQVISASVFPHSNSSIVLKNSSIICYWTTDSNIYYSASEDGLHFSVPEKYGLFDGRPFYCITYKNNSKDINSSISGNIVPGNFSNGYRLAFSDAVPFKIPVTNIIPRTYEHTNRTTGNEDLIAIKDDVKKVSEKLIELEKKVRQIEVSLQKTVNDTSIKVNKLRINERPVGVQEVLPKPSVIEKKSEASVFNDTLTEKFKYLESKFVDDFVQDPKIEEIKKEIASIEKAKNRGMANNINSTVNIDFRRSTDKMHENNQTSVSKVLHNRENESEINPLEVISEKPTNPTKPLNTDKLPQMALPVVTEDTEKEQISESMPAVTDIKKNEINNNPGFNYNLKSNNVLPIMPGRGFSQVTTEYLRNLGKNK